VSFTLLPAVDVADGQAVRLIQGEAGSETGYGDPLDAALQWQTDGAEWIHLVDLDAAFGRGSNAELLAAVIGKLDVAVELSGGIRDDDSLARALSTGCARVNLGTAALEYGSPEPDTGLRPAAGRPTAATSGRPSSGWIATGAPATWSPTSARTARCAGRTWIFCGPWPPPPRHR
jgi:hypothetical protein